jgi:ATP-dependent RNA helicase RhlE
MKFEELWLIGPLLKTITREGFDTSTEIQEKVIPLANKGKDILGCAQTGSWKTLAFVLPILQELYNARIAKDLPDGPIKRKIEALIIAPTRELAVQIGEACKVYCSDTNMKHTVIFGWVNDFHQIKAIEKWVDILIATPGRLEDLISQGKIKLSYVKILTLDEADRMLDLGFLSDVKKVLKRVPKDKQTFLFSATMPKPIRQLADELLHCPEKITIKSKKPTLEMIDQQVYHIKTSHRRQLLQMLVRRKEYSSIIVFVKKKDDVAYITEYVKSSGIKVDCIHKDRTQNGRQNALKALKNGDIKVLVATDIASRGLDINDLSCVINWNVPNEAETYVHRIGRTARAGKKWVAITMCIDHEKDDFIKIEKLIGQKIKIIDDKSYLEQVISKSRILWYKNFDENGKEKFKDIKRKWAKSRKSDPKYGKAGRLEAKNK